MAWQQLVDTGSPGWVQYADLATADAWIAQAVALTSPMRAAALEARPYSEQWDATVLAWAALSNVYRAANIRPLADPIFRAWWKRWHGTPGTAVFERSTVPGTIPARLRTWWLALGKDPSNGFEKIIPRVSIDFATGVQTVACPTWPHGNDDCSFDGWFNGCTSTPDREDGCTAYTWHCFAWHDPPNFGFFASDTHTTVRALPPAYYFWEMATELAAALSRRGARVLIDDAHAFVPLSNLKLAVQLGYSLPDELRRAAAMLPADLSALSEGSNSERALITTTLTTIAIVVAQAGGVPGAIVGAVLGLVAAIVQVMPFATGAPIDGFGRYVPSWDVVPIWTDTEHAPLYTVPMPQPFAAVLGKDGTPQLPPPAQTQQGTSTLSGGAPPGGPASPTPYTVSLVVPVTAALPAPVSTPSRQPTRKLMLDVDAVTGAVTGVTGAPTQPINVWAAPSRAATPLAGAPMVVPAVTASEPWYRSPVVVLGAATVFVAVGAYALKHIADTQTAIHVARARAMGQRARLAS